LVDEIVSNTGYTISGDIIDRLIKVPGVVTSVRVNVWNQLIVPFTNDTHPAVFGGTVEIADILPDMTQVEFLKGIFQMLGIMPQTDNVSKNIQMVQLDELITNQDKAVNLSDKMDTSQPPLIQYSAGNYAQVNRLIYKQDNLNAEFGAGSLLVDDQTLIGERTMFELPFAPTFDDPGINFLQTIGIPQIIKLDAPGGMLKTSTEPRILFMRRGPGTEQFASPPNGVDYTDGITTVNVSGVTMPICHFDVPALTTLMSLDLDTVRGLISVHYSTHRDRLLVRPKSITQNFKLNQVDISSIDHSLPVFIESMSEFFYLNSVNNYIGGRLTAVNLKRL